MVIKTRSPISLKGYLVLGALTMITPLATNLFVPALPSIALAFDTSTSATQLTVSATLIGIAMGQLVIGSLSDYVGRRMPALVGTGAFVVLSILCAFAPSLTVLVLLRFLQGFAGASGVVLARASIRDRTSGPFTAQALSRLLVVAVLAPIIGPFIGALALQVIDWHGVFVVLAFAGSIALLMTFFWFPETWNRHLVSKKERALEGLARRELMRDPNFWWMVIVTGLLGLIMFSWLSTGSFFLAEQYNIDATEYSLILGLSAIAFLISAWINSRAVLVIGPYKALVRGLFIIGTASSVVLVSSVLHWPLPVVIASTVLSVGAFGGMIANAQAIAMEHHGNAAGTASAFLGSSQFLLGALIPPIITAIFGDTWSMGATMFIAAVIALGVTRLARRGSAPRNSC
jgi:DHA1 family bicyclomycin/chloramphenicol resistance-like MFS transporter